MPGCAVKGCSASGAKGLSMFRVPTTSPRRSAWRNAIRRSPEKSSASWYVCELHFADWDLPGAEDHGRGKLSTAAIPSIFCDCPGYSASSAAASYPTSSVTTELNLHTSSTSNVRRRINFSFQKENRAPGDNESSLQLKRKIVGEHSAGCSLMKRRKLCILTNTAFNVEDEVTTTRSPEEVAPIHVPHASLDSSLLSQDLRLECFVDNAESQSRSVGTVSAKTSTAHVGTSTQITMHSMRQREKLFEKTEKDKITLRQSNQNLRNELASEKKKTQKLQSEKKDLQEQLKLITTRGKFGSDQLVALAKPSNLKKKCTWLPATITEGLKLWFAAGGSAYSSVVRVLGKPMPSLRTLERHIQDIQMMPGFQEQIFRPLGLKLEALADEEVDFVLGFDEMALKKGVQYNKGTKSFVGYCTLPRAQGLASKANLYSIAGVKLRIKQILGYDFTSEHESAVQGVEVANRIIDGVKRCAEVRAKVIAVVADMGNKAIWRCLGIRCTKNQMMTWIPHPAYPGERLYFLADVCHLFKNAVEMLKTHKTFTLSEDIVKEFGLPSAIVDFSHFQKLIDFQEDDDGKPVELKITPTFAKYNLKSNHFNKMKVSNARKIVNHRNAVALQVVSEETETPEMMTTAWFTSLLHYWFLYCTARTHNLALSLKNKEAYDEAIGILTQTMRVFQSLNIGNVWKPVQSGVIFTTSALLDLQEYLLVQRKYDFVLLGYFTQDFVENEFSQYRRTWKNITAIQFEQKTKLRILSRFFEPPSKSSSYDVDNREETLDISAFRNPPSTSSRAEDQAGPSTEEQVETETEYEPGSSEERGVEEEPPECPSFDVIAADQEWQPPPRADRSTPACATTVSDSELPVWQPPLRADRSTPAAATTVSDSELPVVYHLSGYILRRFAKERRSCETCIAAATQRNTAPHPLQLLTSLASFKDGALVMASDALFQLLLSVEQLFRTKRSTQQRDFLTCAMGMAEPLIAASPLPACHQKAKNVTCMYLEMRLYQWGASITNSLTPKEREEGAYSSRSMAAVLLTNNWSG